MEQGAEKLDIPEVLRYLGVRDKRGEDRYYCVFGQYVLTSKVFELLGRNIAEGRSEKGEFELTSVLREICRTEGMMACRVDGRRYDIGIPQEYRRTMTDFVEHPGIA